VSILILASLYWQPVRSATLYVSTTGTDSGNCQVTPCKTIQYAISQASANDTIIVAAGTYTETGQIVISKNLSIVGAGAGTTIIKPSADTGNSGDSRGWFLVNPGYTFNLSNVTLDGTGKKIWQAIRHKGQGTVSNCAFTNIKYEESGPSYSGFGMAVFGSPAMNVHVTNCTFSGIGRVGVLYYGTGITGSTFSNNTYIGKGDGDWLDYGVEVGAGAIVTITGNTISGNTGVASDGSTSAGILATTYYGAGTQAVIMNNNIYGNTDGIAVGYLSDDTSLVNAHYNNIYNNTFGVNNVSTAVVVDAENNWWGECSGPFHPTLNPGGTGNAVSNNVDFIPWTKLQSCFPPKRVTYKNMVSAAQNHISEAKDLITQTQDLLSQAKAKGKDTSTCEKLISEAQDLLSEAKSVLTNPIYANNLAMEAIKKLKQAIDCLKALLC